MTENNEVAGKTDEELVILTLKNQDYFLYLVRRYEQKLLYYILRITNVSKEEAQDILQEIFIKIYTNLNDFDPTLKFSSWAYRITHNQVISHYRQRKSRPQSLDINGEEFLEKLAADFNISQEVDRQFLKQNVIKILNQLDFKYREVLILKFLEEKNYKEISDIIKKPMGTVATLINRAKKKFREAIDRQKINFK